MAVKALGFEALEFKTISHGLIFRKLLEGLKISPVVGLASHIIENGKKRLKIPPMETLAGSDPFRPKDLVTEILPTHHKENL